MPKIKVEEYNYFTCPECDEDGLTRMSTDEFRKHLVDVHQITETKGIRNLVMHADAATWFSYVWAWTIGGKTFMQLTKQARSQKFNFKF